jgi:hypothetical protein
MTRPGVNPPGAGDPDLEPAPTSEEEENERRERIKLPELVQWYRDHDLPLDVPLRDWDPEVDGRLRDAVDG